MDEVALNIKDPDTDRLARELAAVAGESITVATRRAIAERLARLRARADSEPRLAELHAIVRRGRQRPMLDERSDDEILGYDSAGVP